MTINGGIFYGVASLLTRHGTDGGTRAARLLFTIAAFALLHQLVCLVPIGEDPLRLEWIYAAAALAIMLLSERRHAAASTTLAW